MYLSANVCISVCMLYIQNRELIIAIGFLFLFALFCQTNFKLIDATLFIPEVGFYINCFGLLS